MSTLIIILALCGGALLSIQAAINGRLGSGGGAAQRLFNLCHRRAGDRITDPVFAPATSVTLLQVPKWQLLGAFCGVPYIVIMVLAVQRIGTATATVAVIFGQLTMSLLIDNFGWLGNSTMAFSPARLAAVICGHGAVLNLYLREVGCLRQGGPRRTVSRADASGNVNTV